MVLIALIFVICIITSIWTYKADWPKASRRTAVIIAFIISSLVLIPHALFATFAGFEEMKCVEEIELLPLQDMEQEGVWYLYKVSTYAGDKMYTYAYDNMEEYSLEGKAYDEHKIYVADIEKIYESDECTRPVMKRFQRKGKPSIFSFAIGRKEEEIIFFVPTGSILEESK